MIVSDFLDFFSLIIQKLIINNLFLLMMGVVIAYFCIILVFKIIDVL